MKPGAMSTDNAYTKRKIDERFILEVLMKKGEDLRDQMLSKYEKQVNGFELSDRTRDQALIARLHEVEMEPLLRAEVETIKLFVGDCYKDWCAIWGNRNQDPFGASRRANRMERSSSKKVQELAEKFASFPTERAPTLRVTHALTDIKALCAYQKGAKFGFAVAFQALCEIKASMDPSGKKAITREFAELMSISPGAVRVVAQRASVLGERT